MKTGDIYEIDPGGALVIVGVVCEPADDAGYFEGWELHIARRDGKLYSFTRAIHNLSNHVGTLVWLSPAPEPEPSGGPMASTVDQLDPQLRREVAAAFRNTILYVQPGEPHTWRKAMATSPSRMLPADAAADATAAAEPTRIDLVPEAWDAEVQL